MVLVLEGGSKSTPKVADSLRFDFCVGCVAGDDVEVRSHVVASLLRDHRSPLNDPRLIGTPGKTKHFCGGGNGMVSVVPIVPHDGFNPPDAPTAKEEEREANN